MTEDIFGKLDDVFAQRDAQQQASQKAAQDRQTLRAANLAAFKEARNVIFRPAMEEVGQYLKSKGQSFRIDTEQQTGGSVETFISFNILPENVGYTPSNMRVPYLTVRAAETTDQVYFSRNTAYGNRGGTSGSDGSAGLSEVTADYLKKKLVDLIAEVFRPK